MKNNKVLIAVVGVIATVVITIVAIVRRNKSSEEE